MPARLVPLTPALSPPISLERPVILIGRHAECDVQIHLTQISRRHCCIAQVANDLVIRDLGSRTGVRINGYLIEESPLQPGDEVAIGPVLFRFDLPTATPNRSSTPIQDSGSGLDEDSDLIPFDG
ncbi:hypothetical protein BH23PLA1_BH23PLA1_02400 [soil metagenome]